MDIFQFVISSFLFYICHRIIQCRIVESKSKKTTTGIVVGLTRVSRTRQHVVCNRDLFRCLWTNVTHAACIITYIDTHTIGTSAVTLKVAFNITDDGSWFHFLFFRHESFKCFISLGDGHCCIHTSLAISAYIYISGPCPVVGTTDNWAGVGGIEK